MISTGLANGRVGADYGYQWAIRFQAKFDGEISGCRSEWIIENPVGKTGYAAGWRGDFLWLLCADAPGPTAGADLSPGFRRADPRFPEYVNNGCFPFVFFPGVAVEAGKWYWIVVSNQDADPKNNYASIDFLLGDVAQTPEMQVWWRWQQGGSYVSWQQKAGWLPSPFAIYYADGGTQGYNGIEIDSSGNVVPGTQYGFPENG